MSVFYNSPVLTTSGYLARAVVNNVLKESEENEFIAAISNCVMTLNFIGIHIPQDHRRQRRQHRRLQLSSPVRVERNASIR